MQNIIIHCKPSMLSTIKDLELDYHEYFDEVDVTIPYTLDVMNVNKGELIFSTFFTTTHELLHIIS